MSSCQRMAALLSLTLLAPSVSMARSTAVSEASEASADEQRQQDAVSITTLHSPETAPLIVAVKVNGELRGEILLLRLGDGSVLARREDWQAWRLIAPRRAPLKLKDGEWWDLRLAPGFVYRLDEPAARLEIDFAPGAFQPSNVSTRPSQLIVATRPDRLGAYLNYDLFASRQQTRGQAPGESVNGLVETVLFHPEGSLSSQWLGLDLLPGSSPSRGREVVRLDSSWQHDDPEAMTTLVIGDAIGSAGLYGRASRFGGVRYGRNFGTQPGLITLPQPALSGESSLPSVLEVFVDGVRRDSQRIPAGPFSVTDIPAVNGQGQVQVVVRDLLGREQLLSLPYLSSSQQLKAGLHDYSVEAGYLREQFGRRSDDYGDFTATTEHLYGVSDALTAEGRLELRQGGSVTAGLGAISSVPRLGVVTTAGAYSQNRGQDGGLALLGWQRYFGLRFNLGLRAAFASRHFKQTGTSDLPPPKSSLTASAGLPLTARASLGLSYLRQRDRALAGQGAQDTEAITALVSARVGRGALSAQVFQRLAPRDDLGLGLVYSRSFGGGISASASVRQQRPETGAETTQFGAGVQRGLPAGEGYGWRLQALQDAGDLGDNGSAEAGVSANTRFGSGAVDVALGDGSTAYRATASGSLVAFAGHLLPARRIGSSFALVEAGAPDIAVRVNNQASARSNPAGIALLPDVIAYLPNQVDLDAGALPLAVALEAQTTTVTPYYRSGLKVRLAAPASLSALVQLLGSDGKPIPALSTVQKVGGDEPLSAARQGLVYLSDLMVGETLLKAADGPCRWRILLPPDAGLQPTLGPFACEQNAP